MTGTAFCSKCNTFIQIMLTGVSEPCSHCSGRNWECEQGQHCYECGNPLLWLHQPGPDDLRADEWVRQNEDVPSQRER